MNDTQLPYGMHWFRRDLRVVSNPALTQNLKQNNGRVVGIFFFDSKFLARSDFSRNRFGFFLKTLQSLKKEMTELGGDLLILDTVPLEGFTKLIETLRTLQITLPHLCSWNRDYEPFARDRDANIEQALFNNYGIETLTTPDHLLLEPHDVCKPDRSTYQVFTPFSKKWLSKLSEAQGESRLAEAKDGLRFLRQRDKGEKLDRVFRLKWKDLLNTKHPGASLLPLSAWEEQLENFFKTNLNQVTVPLPPAGGLEAYRQLMKFKGQLTSYSKGRDYPSQDHSSHLSIYLKNGSLTTAQIFAVLGSKPGSQPFLRQLIWREFYYHILFHHPRVEKEAFRKKYKNLRWQNRIDWFEAWRQGQTGFPLIDAGMRQLLQTGFMHNRVRMVVASFLTKDLLIDWRWGEQWFMQNLLDGDLAANNGGWQWAASTGCDPQPYFRIFNPELQSRRFDPKGDYIRTYVPELRECTDREIHAPLTQRRPPSYPPPLVIHAQQKLAALRLFT